MYTCIIRFMLACSLGHGFFLMIRRPPRSTLDRSSAASDVYKRQTSSYREETTTCKFKSGRHALCASSTRTTPNASRPVSYTHLRAHETVLDLVCRLLLEKKNFIKQKQSVSANTTHHDKNTHNYM